MVKNSKVKAEYKRLSELYVGLPEAKRKLAEKLISNAAYMAIVLEDLQNTVKTEGAILTAKNGNGFETVQEHPAQKSYNTMINRYAGVIKQLADMLPESAPQTSKLDAFLNDE